MQAQLLKNLSQVVFKDIMVYVKDTKNKVLESVPKIRKK